MSVSGVFPLPPPRHPSYGVMALAPTGLSPVEHVCLYWTHKIGGPIQHVIKPCSLKGDNPRREMEHRDVVLSDALQRTSRPRKRLCQLFVRSTTQRLGLPRTQPTMGGSARCRLSLFEQSLAEWLAEIRSCRRCVYDPVCIDRGGSCHACTHLAETRCRFFNLNLGRPFLFGGSDPIAGNIDVGFLDSLEVR